MKVLLDENLPVPIAKLLLGYDCRTVEQCGWVGIKNGKLLTLAQTQFDIFLTADQNIRYQQNLSGFDIAILELSTNDFRRLKSSIDLIRSALVDVKPRTLSHLIIP